MTEAHQCDGCIAVIIPTYNERDNIHPITERVLSAIPEADLFIIDDNSPDGTGEIADELAAKDERIHVVHRRGKEGLATAYLTGFEAAL
ncbi:MAG TPA: glycosyltransferase, partial [Trebonia sp.]